MGPIEFSLCGGVWGSILRGGERSRGKSTEEGRSVESERPTLDSPVDIQTVYTEIIEELCQVARGCSDGTVSHRDSVTAL
jgi:hypothetical protein